MRTGRTRRAKLSKRQAPNGLILISKSWKSTPHFSRDSRFCFLDDESDVDAFLNRIILSKGYESRSVNESRYLLTFRRWSPTDDRLPRAAFQQREEPARLQRSRGH